MSLTPVGKNKVMKGQMVRGSFSTDFSSLLKIANPIPPQGGDEGGGAQEMNPQKPEGVVTQEYDLGGDAGAMDDFEQDSGQEAQQLDQSNPQVEVAQPGQNPAVQQQTQQAAVEKRKQDYKNILKLERALLQKLKAKQLKTKFTVKTSPKGMTVTFDTSHRILDLADNQPKDAEEALSDVIEWAKAEVGMDVTYEVHGGDDSGRAIDPNKERVSFVFSYTPDKAEKQDENDITTMGGRGQAGQPGQKPGQQPGQGAPQQRVGKPQQAGQPQGGQPQMKRQVASVMHLPTKFASQPESTLPEMMAGRKADLVKTLGKIIAGQGAK